MLRAMRPTWVFWVCAIGCVAAVVFTSFKLYGMARPRGLVGTVRVTHEAVHGKAREPPDDAFDERCYFVFDFVLLGLELAGCAYVAARLVRLGRMR
jgi:hypothetical protein